MIDRELWHFDHGDRDATYFLIEGVDGEPVLGGEEALVDDPANTYRPMWATAEELEKIGLQPEQIRGPLRAVIER